jgi:hypothetical protein
LKWYDGGGENGITSKRIFEAEVFLSSQNIDFPFYLRRLLKLFSFFFLFLLFSFFFFFSMLNLLRTEVLMIFEEKLLLEKPLFKWHDMEWHCHDYVYTGGGCIFWNRVMHANIAKP